MVSDGRDESKLSGNSSSASTWIDPDGVTDRPRLICLQAGEAGGIVAGSIHILPDRGSFVIGRDPSSDLAIASPRLSRQHIRLTAQEDAWLLEDLESKNGTRVNGKPVSSRLLSANDVIEVGRTEFRFLPPGAQAADPEAQQAANPTGYPNHSNAAHRQSPAGSSMSWKAGLIGAGLALAIAAGAVTFMSDKKAPDLPQVAAQQDTANQPASPLGSTTQALAEADIARMKAEAEAEKARAEAETAKAQAELAKAQAELAAARAEVDAARSKAETSPAKAPSQQAQPIPGNAATPQMTDGWLSREERKAVQAALIERKLLAGSADGIFGPASRKAISAFQQSSGFPPDGYLTPDQAGPLLSEGKAALAEIIKKAQPTEIAQAPAKTAPAALPQSTAQETAPAPASAVAASSAPITRKAGRAMGPQACRKCHGPEAGVWEGTKHFKSFSSVHRNSKAKKIVRAVGDKRMKKSATCALCHYTLDGASGAPIAGPSCESCHGNSENWIKIHNDYGPALKRDNESPAQKAERRKRASAAGMIWPDQLFDVAMNCNSCHGLANPLLSAEQAAAMLDNGHPINPDFELVEYSQGSVRHRFYPPNTGENPVLSQKEQAEYFAIGQIATYLSASQALGKTSHAGYATAQKARAAKAAKALASLKGRFAAVAAFLSSPSTSKARKAVASLSGQDLTAEVGGMLPSSFK